MSELRRSLAAQAKSDPESPSSARAGHSRFAGWRKHWPVYAGIAVIAILALAWFDGGYEPIHPIEQPVELDPLAKGTN